MRTHFCVGLAYVAVAWIASVAALGEGEFVHPSEAAPARQFDFWLGEWDVTNRFLQEDGSWQEVPAIAKIWASLDGQVIVEHWASRSEQWPMRGFSMRAYDPETETWTIALCWPNPAGEAANFSFMEGAFRNGRGEFFRKIEEGGEPGNVRFTFSDASANSLRWDQAIRTDDGGWRTTWIMEWARRGEDAPLDMEWVHGLSDGEARSNDVLRQLDGSWEYAIDIRGAPQKISPGKSFSKVSRASGLNVLDERAVLLEVFEMGTEIIPPGVRTSGPASIFRRIGLLLHSDGEYVYCEAALHAAGFTVFRGVIEEDVLPLVVNSDELRHVIEFVDKDRIFWTLERADSGLWMPLRRMTLDKQP